MLTLQAYFIGKILMRRKFPFIVLVADAWPAFSHLPLPSSLLKQAQTRRGACLSLKRLFVSMVTCLLHLQRCKLGNSIKGFIQAVAFEMVSDISCLLHSPLLPSNLLNLVILANGGSKMKQYEADYNRSDWPRCAHSSGTVMGCLMEHPGCLWFLWPRPTSALVSGSGDQHASRSAWRGRWGQLEKREKLALLSKMTLIVNGFQVLSLRFCYAHVEFIIPLLWKQL